MLTIDLGGIVNVYLPDVNNDSTQHPGSKPVGVKKFRSVGKFVSNSYSVPDRQSEKFLKLSKVVQPYQRGSPPTSVTNFDMYIVLS